MPSKIQRTELLIASILPTTATLFVGVISIEQMQELDIRFLLAVLLVSAAVCCLEYAIISFMQRTIRNQADELVLVCHDYLSGDRQRRPDVSADHALSTLARTLHMVLEAASQDALPESSLANASSKNMPSNTGREPEQSQQLDTQIQKLIREIMPVTQGDLRVRAEIPQGNIGVIADLCNAFIEEIIELVLWIRYSSSQIKNATNGLVSGSIELAQTAETQMLHFSQTTKMAETLTNDLENFYGTLQLNADVVQKLQMYVRQYVAGASFEKHDLLQRLEADTKHQEQLLEEVLSSAQSNVMLAKSLISDFYTFARRIYESSVGVLQAAEHIKSVSALAEQWYTTVTAFQLPVSAEEKIVQASANNGSPPLPAMKM